MRRFGSKVSIIDRNDRLLHQEDDDVTEVLGGLFQDEGIDLILNARIKRVSRQSGQRVKVIAEQNGIEKIKNVHWKIRHIQQKQFNPWITCTGSVERMGAYRSFRTIAEPYPSADGKSYCWYGVATDIDELYRSRELLRERELQLNLLTENLPTVLFKAAPDGRFVYVNQRGIEYIGRTVEDLQQKGKATCTTCRLHV